MTEGHTQSQKKQNKRKRGVKDLLGVWGGIGCSASFEGKGGGGGDEILN